MHALNLPLACSFISHVPDSEFSYAGEGSANGRLKLTSLEKQKRLPYVCSSQMDSVVTRHLSHYQANHYTSSIGLRMSSTDNAGFFLPKKYYC